MFQTAYNRQNQALNVYRAAPHKQDEDVICSLIHCCLTPGSSSNPSAKLGEQLGLKLDRKSQGTSLILTHNPPFFSNQSCISNKSTPPSLSTHSWGSHRGELRFPNSILSQNTFERTGADPDLPAPWRLRKGWPTTWNNASVHEVLNIPCMACLSDGCLHPRCDARPPPGARAVKCRFYAIKKTHIDSWFWLWRLLAALSQPSGTSCPPHLHPSLCSGNDALSDWGHMPTSTEAIEEKTQIS